MKVNYNELPFKAKMKYRLNSYYTTQSLIAIEIAKHNPDIFHTKSKDGKPVRVNVVTLPLYGGTVNNGVVVQVNNKKFGHYSIEQLKDFASQSDEFVQLIDKDNHKIEVPKSVFEDALRFYTEMNKHGIIDFMNSFVGMNNQKPSIDKQIEMLNAMNISQQTLVKHLESPMPQHEFDALKHDRP